MKPKTAAAAWTAAGLLTMGGLAGAVTLGAGAASADTGPSCPAAVVSGATATVTCPYTGGPQYWTVPDGITSATFTLYGAAGGSWAGSAAGGLGAEVTGTLAVTPGQVLQVNAGQAGTVNGPDTFGGGGHSGPDAGSGGGASDVRTPAGDGSYPLTGRVLVAGGGGGGGENGPEEGGGAGGNAGSPGQAGAAYDPSGAPQPTSCGETLGGGAGGDAGAPAGDSAGGAGGLLSASCAMGAAAGDDGAAGTQGAGGDGGNDGGGGGGGYTGGGGGGGGASDHFDAAGGGGGGGSSFTDPSVTGTAVTDGVSSPGDGADGEVVITWQLPLQAQAISWFPLPATAVPGTSVPLIAIGGGSGNPVTFTADPASDHRACSVVGNLVNFTGAGTCIIDASQAGNDTFAAAPQVQQSVTVTQQDQAITGFTLPATAAAGTTAPLTAADGGSGNPVTFTADPASGDGVCSVSGDVVDFTAAGTCVIDADQAGSDAYAAAPQVQQTVTVTAPPATAAALTLADTAPASVHDGKRLAYTLTVTNTGGTAATGVTVTDVLPPIIQFEQATASQGAACSYAGKKKGGTLTCTAGRLAPGATLTVTIDAHATSPGTVSDAAAVTADGMAAVTASAPVTVGP